MENFQSAKLSEWLYSCKSPQMKADVLPFHFSYSFPMQSKCPCPVIHSLHCMFFLKLPPYVWAIRVNKWVFKDIKNYPRKCLTLTFQLYVNLPIGINVYVRSVQRLEINQLKTERLKMYQHLNKVCIYWVMKYVEQKFLTIKIWKCATNPSLKSVYMF